VSKTISVYKNTPHSHCKSCYSFTFYNFQRENMFLSSLVISKRQILLSSFIL